MHLLFPGLYAVINNAGVCVCGEFDWQTWPQIRRQVEVNLLGTLRVTKHFLPLLKAGEGEWNTLLCCCKGWVRIRLAFAMLLSLKLL